MQIKGIVYEIIFRNDENGYTVLDCDINGELTTCVGVFSFIAEGEEIEMHGEFVNNARYGRQFSVKNYSTTSPESITGIIRYLGSGILPGIGEAMAERIVKHFGKDALNIIEFNPRRLSEVKGISADGAMRIGARFGDIKKMKDTIMFLQKHDVSINMAMRIYDVYKDATIEKVGKNPYRLVEDVDGIGFLTADRIAQKLGIKADSPFRCRASIIYTLKRIAEQQGSTYAIKHELFGSVSGLLGISIYPVFENSLVQLKLENMIKTFINENELECIALASLWNTEQNIAAKLTLLHGTSSIIADGQNNLAYDQEIKQFEALNKIKFHESQQHAISMALNNNISIITGGPGTGKTTIIRCIHSILTAANQKSLLLAPTGRAAKRLSESVGAEAKTIHRGLEVLPLRGRLTFRYNEQNKLPADCIIVDEVSMIDCILMTSLLKALNQNCRLILIGDQNQLPSVGAGNVLADIIESACFPVAQLKHIYRQDEKSLIIESAYKILNGETPNLTNKSSDFFFEKKEEPGDIANTVVELVIKRLPEFDAMGLRPQDIQVLAPLRAGKAGVDALNSTLQQQLNPQKFGQRDIEFERVHFRLGDKVMQTQNNYEIKWQKQNEISAEDGTGVFNGDIGTITALDAATGEVDITFDDGRLAHYVRTDLHQITLAYAITVHKSQGCEFDAVVIPVVMGAPIIFTRNLLYTAVTRAKKLVVLVGTKMAISRMVRNNYTEKRSTHLKRMLLEKQEEFKKLYE